jgi:hypothetical protein
MFWFFGEFYVFISENWYQNGTNLPILYPKFHHEDEAAYDLRWRTFWIQNVILSTCLFLFLCR